MNRKWGIRAPRESGTAGTATNSKKSRQHALSKMLDVASTVVVYLGLIYWAWVPSVYFLCATVFILMYWRSLPLAYHLRFLWYIIRGKFLTRRPPTVHGETELQLRCWPDDVDFNSHMGNSSYNKVCDFARYHHLCAMGFGQISGANGGVYMRFKRSIQPMQPYSLRTRVIAWGAKWLLIEHRFIADGRVKAAGIVKVAVMQGGSLLAPLKALHSLGYTDAAESDTADASALDNLLATEAYFGKDDKKCT